MQRVSIIRLTLKHLAIEPVGLAKTPLLMVGQRLLQGVADRELRPVVHSLLSSFGPRGSQRGALSRCERLSHISLSITTLCGNQSVNSS